MKPEQFQAALAQMGVNLSADQMAQFEQYYQYLIEVNQHLNLTRITAKEDVYLKHFYDSLMGAFAEPQLKDQPWHLCDIGAGAGFPSLPLKIAFPQLQVTIVDSDRHRKDVADALGVNFALPADAAVGCDLVIHTSATAGHSTSAASR